MIHNNLYHLLFGDASQEPKFLPDCVFNATMTGNEKKYENKEITKEALRDLKANYPTKSLKKILSF